MKFIENKECGTISLVNFTTCQDLISYKVEFRFGAPVKIELTKSVVMVNQTNFTNHSPTPRCVCFKVPSKNERERESEDNTYSRVVFSSAR